MAEQNDAQEKWLSVIGRALAYLCLQQAEAKKPKQFDSVLKRVKFLESLGLSRHHAAKAAGSSSESVAVLHSLQKRRRGKYGKGKKKSAH